MLWRNYFQAFFQKIKIEHISESVSKVLYNLLLMNAKLGAINIYWNQAANHLLLPNIKLF